MVHENIIDALRRLQELNKQLHERAQLYRHLGAPEIADEFQRLSRVELQPVLHLLSDVVEAK